MTLVCRELTTFYTRSPLNYRCKGLPYRAKNERVNSWGSWIGGRVLHPTLRSQSARVVERKSMQRPHFVLGISDVEAAPPRVM